MKKLAVLFWWFLAINSHVITVAGPFANDSQCVGIRDALFMDNPDLKVSACWSDEIPPRTVRQ